MPYEYSTQPAPKKGLISRMRKGFYTSMHGLARILRGFKLNRMAGGVYKMLVNMDDHEAMFQLGDMYFWGYKYIRDPVKAVELIEYAAIRGNERARKFKKQMTEDGLWRQGKGRDEFMDMYDNQVIKEDNQPKSVNLWLVLLYTVILAGIVYLVGRP